MSLGRAARFAFDPAVLVAFLDDCAGYVKGGHPVRNRYVINGCHVSDNDARVIRRWRKGQIKGVTKAAALGLLDRHGLTIDDFITWAAVQQCQPVIRGRLNPAQSS